MRPLSRSLLLSVVAVAVFTVFAVAAPVPSGRVDEQKFEAAVVAAIHLFAEHGEVDHLRTLLEQHPKLVDERRRFSQPRKPVSTDAYTPLHWAARTGRAEVVELLLRHRAEPEADSGGGWTSLHLAARGGHLGAVKMLVRHGAKTGARTVARKKRVMVPPSSPPGALPVRFPAVPAMTPLDVAASVEPAGVIEYPKSVTK